MEKRKYEVVSRVNDQVWETRELFDTEVDEVKNNVAKFGCYLREVIAPMQLEVSVNTNIGQAGELGMTIIEAQREKGIAKYGQPIEDSGITALALLHGAAEELADGLVYACESLRRLSAAPRLYMRQSDVIAMTGANHVATLAVSAIQTEEFNTELVGVGVLPS